MSVSVLGAAQQDSIVTSEELSTLASKYNLTIPASDLPDYAALLAGLNHCAKEILTKPDYYPAVDLSLYPRTDIHRPSGPETTDKGGLGLEGYCEEHETKEQ